MAINWPGFVPGIESVRSSTHLNPHTSHTMKYQAYTLGNLASLPQHERLSTEQIRAIEVVGNVLPFRVSSYVTDELIDWDHLDDDPMFNLTFPQRGMLLDPDYHAMDQALQSGADRREIQAVANEIRARLNPHPAGQLEHNVPTIDGEPLRVSAETLRSWVRRYRKGGLPGLMDKPRPQRGVQALTPDAVTAQFDALLGELVDRMVTEAEAVMLPQPAEVTASGEATSDLGPAHVVVLDVFGAMPVGSERSPVDHVEWHALWVIAHQGERLAVDLGATAPDAVREPALPLLRTPTEGANRGRITTSTPSLSSISWDGSASSCLTSKR